MPDETIESLKQAFMKDKDNISDECPMADQISEFAFGELGHQVSKEAEEHLKSCRSCLDLFMDIRMAEDDAVQIKNEKVEVLPGLKRAIEKGKRPSVSIWQKISEMFSEFFSAGFTLKPIATFATVAMVMILGFYMMQGGTDKTPYAIEIMMQGRTKVGYRAGQPEYKEFQVDPGGIMSSGDYFRFQATIDNDAFIYVVFQDSSRSIHFMEKSYINKGTELFLPDGNKWYHLDDNTGIERLYLLASKNQIDDFSNRIDKLKKDGIEAIEKVFPDATVKGFSFEHR